MPPCSWSRPGRKPGTSSKTISGILKQSQKRTKRAAFSLAAVGLFFGFLGVELGLIAPDFLGNIIFQIEGVLRNDLLLAIPFFTLMGAILERSGLAEDLLDGFGQLFGGVRGGLSYAVILVGAVLGAITGTVAASSLVSPAGTRTARRASV